LEQFHAGIYPSNGRTIKKELYPMKKVNLSFLAVMIISLVIILIINTMAVFAYRDEVITIENRKDNMLCFNIKHSGLLEGLYSNARQYLQTNDDKYKSEFYNLLKIGRAHV
jgi:hypothetical protein